MINRIDNLFNDLKKQNRTAFISFVTGGDPDLKLSEKIIEQLPKNGTDLIEIGIPFLDPAGDGRAQDAILCRQPVGRLEPRRDPMAGPHQLLGRGDVPLGPHPLGAGRLADAHPNGAALLATQVQPVGHRHSLRPGRWRLHR